ncbi:MAG: rRNA maturation RNase YbeY [Gammaproteobacteria bacterium]|jgi:probable rRNA maturation factor|nr:rRNA maturation RNase YbeY [Gammaproteobacteria bacterium]MBU0770487.1 rRNA maturation RNase YbeY [Gammaproteobacteria bacterium]MBU0856337.1 rRNA maturation RNase YbeY [Gammaproteobacteria bacterium]MBU1845991.1 rRNA maturation RNase YbeY [Gammaproteobacteria bacterium]
MRLNLSVQYACPREACPQREDVKRWVRAALDPDVVERADIAVRFVDDDEARVLNLEYRQRDYATNVLSFPYSQGAHLSGDLVVCQPVLAREALSQRKSFADHATHLIVHGVLHLQGWDHETSEQDAEAMEDEERIILSALGVADPYAADAV